MKKCRLVQTDSHIRKLVNIKTAWTFGIGLLFSIFAHMAKLFELHCVMFY